jgi:hypothetical protein
MRTRALALLLLLASCGKADPANQTAAIPGVGGPESGTRRPVPTINISATGPGGCSASWDGQPVTPAQITERSIALLERAIAAVGGARNATELNMPRAIVEAPADLSFACADTILFALQRSGMIGVALKPAGGPAPIGMDFPLDTGAPPPPIPTVLGIGAGGRLTWNGDPIDDAGLAAQLTRIGGSPNEVDPMEEAPPPGGLELRVAREANFGQLHALLRTTQRYRLRPVVYLPSVEASPPGQASAGPPDAPSVR